MAIAPASVDLAAAEVQLVNADQRASRLQRAIEHNRIPFDYMLIDTPPSLGLLTLNGLVAATDVLIPVQCHFLAMRGVRALMESLWRVKRRLNPDLRLLGLLPTMYTPDARHADEVIEELKNVFGTKVYDIVVETSIKFAEAPIAREALVDYAPTHPGARVYLQLAEEIINHDG
jgi:chromosome partitioning protein